MTQIPSAKLLVVENAQSYQLNAVHTFVTNNAEWWWHHVPHVWILGEEHARDAVWWREQVKLLAPTLTGPTPLVPTILVLQLPPPGTGREWAYWGPNGTNEIDWISTQYQG